ncbi:MAG: hypothetical protein NTV22_12380 [bacterium]|nr:hypothetical protein [bacterium]
MTRIFLRFMPLLVVVLLVSAVAAPAATFQWAVDGFISVMQIVADGKGGCAVLGAYPGGMCVVWIDKKGAKLYDKTLTGTSSMGILSFDGKTLIYPLTTSPMSLVAVDKKGVETSVSDAAYSMYGVFLGMPYQPNVPRDSKGFFTVQTPTGPGTWRVARYTIK